MKQNDIPPVSLMNSQPKVVQYGETNIEYQRKVLKYITEIGSSLRLDMASDTRSSSVYLRPYVKRWTFAIQCCISLMALGIFVPVQLRARALRKKSTYDNIRYLTLWLPN